MMFGAPDADRRESERVDEAQLVYGVLHFTGRGATAGVDALRNH